MEFSGLLGNEELKKRLSSSFRAGKQSHCYLLCGPEGSGKKTLAAILAQTLQCEAAEPACGHCNICRKIGMGIHPDVITIDDPDKKTVPVELVRQLQADAFVHPNEGKRKIYIIPRAQDLSDSAQNALLKLIEEPPAYAVFLLLTTSREKLLPTVRSRSVELRLEPVSWQQAQPWLQSRCGGESLQALQAAHLRCGGFLGQTLAYLQKDDHSGQIEQFVQAFSSGDRYLLTGLLCAMEKMSRDQLQGCFARWKQLLADALMVRAGMPGTPEAERLGRSRTAQDLAAAAATIQKAMEHSNANVGTGHICGWLAATL